jgi:hypothetical protein
MNSLMIKFTLRNINLNHFNVKHIFRYKVLDDGVEPDPVFSVFHGF